MTPQAHSVDIELHIAVDHPAFAGHFPGAPVLPGVVLLSLVMQAVADAPALAGALGAKPQIDQVKFLAAVGPGQRLQLQMQLQLQGQLNPHQPSAAQRAGVAFEIRRGATAVARGRLSASGL